MHNNIRPLKFLKRKSEEGQIYTNLLSLFHRDREDIFKKKLTQI